MTFGQVGHTLRCLLARRTPGNVTSYMCAVVCPLFILFLCSASRSVSILLVDGWWVTVSANFDLKGQEEDAPAFIKEQ